MPLEIEIKIKVDDPAPIRERLSANGAGAVGRTLEVNTFFDTPQRTLLKSDQGLRLRVARDESGRETFRVTFKSPPEAAAVKSRDELEFSVADAPAAARLFESLGYSPVLLFEKRRETWELDQCEVTLDELPRLGSFVEIEGPSEAAIFAVRDKLALSAHPAVQESYAALVADELARSGGSGNELRFS